MSDREWLIPSLVLTAAAGGTALALIPSYSGIVPALSLLPLWMLAGTLIAAGYGFAAMVAARVPSPIGRARRFFAEDWPLATRLMLCLLLTGVNMTTFMWMKPLLNYHVPFWADPALANIDAALFFGTDPWQLLSFLNSGGLAIFYHRGWFALMVLTLLIVYLAPPSPKRSAAMLTYFLLWSLLGPVIHILLPAAGPVFYEELGHGDRFAGLEQVVETRQVASYLWSIYEQRGFGPGSGISAMPSLHIATTAWMLVSVRALAPRLIVPMGVAGVLIFLLSIALGWHYAVDGIVGGGAAVACYVLLRRVFEARRQARPAVALAGAGAAA